MTRKKGKNKSKAKRTANKVPHFDSQSDVKIDENMSLQSETSNNFTMFSTEFFDNLYKYLECMNDYLHKYDNVNQISNDFESERINFRNDIQFKATMLKIRANMFAIKVQEVSKKLNIDENTQQNSIVQSKFTKTYNAETQTDNMCFNYMSQSKLDVHHGDSPIKQNNECFVKNLNISTTSENSESSKLVRLIIFKVHDKFNWNDIFLSICKSISIPLSPCHLIKILPAKQIGLNNYLIDVSPEVAEKLFSIKRIKIQTQYYHIERYIFVKRCFVCQDFGHEANVCKKNRVCANCAGAHNSSNCKNPPQCINCILLNRSNNIQLHTDHPSFSKKCQSYLRYIQMKRKSIA